MAGQEKKKNAKKPRTRKSAEQYYRTSRNVNKRRERHQKLNPNDKKARENWKASPIRVKHVAGIGKAGRKNKKA